MKPLIFHVRASNFFGGPERQIVGHVRTSQRFDHLVITFRKGGASNEFADVCMQRQINVVALSCAHSYQWTSVRQLRALILQKKPDLICCHGYKPLVVSLLAKGKANVPVVAFSRGHTAENLKVRLFETLEWLLYKWVDSIVAVSHGYARTLIRKGIPTGRITVVHNAVDMEKFVPHIAKRCETRRSFGFTENDVLIATAGRLSPEKAQGDLLSAFANLGKVEQAPHLILCGDGPLRQQLERQAEQLGCRNVHFLGHRTDLDALMPMFDLFVLTSLTEGLPNVLLEAASCRVPLVATRVGGVPEIITDGESGLLVDPGKSEQLSQAIEYCLADREMASRFADAAFRKIERFFGVAGQTLALEELYGNLMKQAHNG